MMKNMETKIQSSTIQSSTLFITNQDAKFASALADLISYALENAGSDNYVELEDAYDSLGRLQPSLLSLNWNKPPTQKEFDIQRIISKEFTNIKLFAFNPKQFPLKSRK